jgi:hypothetical protein
MESTTIKSMSEKSIKSETTSASTLAHELIAKEEQNIGIFFAAFAIQYYFHKEILKQKIAEPVFVKFFGDIDLYASQRVLIKNIINNRHYRPICEELEKYFMEYNSNDEKLPHNIFLGRVNKAFLIRQIFKHTDQVLSKYNFIEKYIGQDIAHLNLDDLYADMNGIQIEQQILVLVRIFIHMKDGFENKKKTLLDSFIENIKRTREDLLSRGKKGSQEMHNLDMMLKFFAHK